MSADQFIEAVLASEFSSREDCKEFYDKMSKIFDELPEVEQQKIRNSMCLEMLERATQ